MLEGKLTFANIFHFSNNFNADFIIMLSGIDYTEKDAEFDSQLVYQEIEDIENTWIMGNGVLSKQHGPNENRVFKNVLAHLRNVRFSKFARDAIELEAAALKCNIDGHTVAAVSCVFEQSIDRASTDYKERLQLSNRIAAVHIPNVELMISESGSVRMEASMKQVRKDIERDRLLVNGVRIVGAELGLEAVQAAIGTICDRVLVGCGLPILGADVRDYLAQSLLSKASRSHSGGIAYQAAQGLVDPAVAMLVPQSAVAPPLKISIQVGAFPGQDNNICKNCGGGSSGRIEVAGAHGIIDIGNSSNCNSNGNAGKWGLVCRVACESIFKVQLFDSPENDGYDDCSMGDGDADECWEGGAAPAMFRPVVRAPAPAATCITNVIEGEGIVEDVPGAIARSAPCSECNCGTGSSSSGCSGGGLELRTRNTFLSVLYEDFVLFDVRLSPAGELSNIEHLRDNWREMASVTITEIEPTRTLM